MTGTPATEQQGTRGETKPDEPLGGDRRRPSESLIRAGQIAGGITAILTLGVFVWTTFVNTGGGAARRPPHASIGEAHASPGVTLRSYLSGKPGALERWIAHARQAGFSASDIAETLGTRGVEADFGITLEGSPGMTVTVSRALFDERTLERVPEEGVTVNPPVSYVTREKPAQFTEGTWVAAPPEHGAYFVELQLLLPHGEPLDTKRTNTVNL